MSTPVRSAWVVFDLDGTLMESEQLWHEVRQRYVVARGGRWSDAAHDAMIGMRTGEWAQYLHDACGVALPPQVIAGEVIALVAQTVGEQLPVLPGAAAALERLAAAFPLGLATSSARPVVDTALAKTGWDALFTAVVSADVVARGKPAPDVYLRAVSELRADPARTVAIEDSGNGIRSAHAAGLAVLAIPNRAYPPDDGALALATRVLRSLDELDAAVITAAVAAPRPAARAPSSP